MSDEENTTNTPMSDDDLAVLQAFDAIEPWQASQTPLSPLRDTDEEEFTHEDMVFLFASEMNEEIGQMKRALSQLEQGDTLDETRFTILRRAAHKIRGTAGAMECHAMASIAGHIEEVVAQITTDTLPPLVGVNALVHAVLALEKTLLDLLTHGQESETPLGALEHELQQLSLALQSSHTPTTPNTATRPLAPSTDAHAPEVQNVQGYSSHSISIEEQRFERLLRFSESLAETGTPLENAQEEVDVALRELHMAQARLQQLERSLPYLMRPALPPQHFSYSSSTLHSFHLPASSLVERMLSGAMPLKKNMKRRSQLIKAYENTEWDELELNTFAEDERATVAIREAIAGVTIANTHVQRAYAHLHTVTQQYVTRAANMHTQLHLLRLTPLSALVSHLHHIMEKSSPETPFLVIGEETEVDQDILDKLVKPLSTLLGACIVDIQHAKESDPQAQRVWLAAQALGNEVTLEIGFSMPVQGGALDIVQPFIQRLQGTIELQRNAEHGASFFIRFPRSQGTVRGLLVRVGDQQLVLPFSHIQRVSDEQHQKTDIIYHLHKLLDFPYEPDPFRRVTPLIILPQGRSRLVAGILVDEVISDVTVVVKPLPHLLRRSGVSGTVLDDKGHVLLLLDIPALLKHYSISHRQTLSDENSGANGVSTQRTQQLALIADDSIVMRKSLSHTLEHAHFATVQARDGLEALDLLTQNPPDICLLDMEMPYMNGFDLLSIIHIYPELSDVKIIMLTSRTTEKHEQRALDLGAHAYLTKPCSPDLLLKTIETVLR